MITQKIKTITYITPDAPVKFKREVGTLLNQLMKDYNIHGENKEFEEAFKSTFKSNLYYKIDNFFKVKGK